MIELLPFQTRASGQIVARYHELVTDDARPMEIKRWATPFYQALSALTGSGKTAILADTLAGLRSVMPAEPLVLWVSKAKAVVEQTLANLEAGGKYAHLIEQFAVRRLSGFKGNVELIKDHTTPLIALATVGSFNRDRGRDALQVHSDQEDGIGGTVWNALRDRQLDVGVRRPLVIVYDEGHNLSDQQTDLLLELEPDAIIVASGTMRTPSKLGRIIDRLKEHGWNNDRLATSVSSKAVVLSGLVKRQVVIGGYATIMELALDDMLADMADTSKKAELLQAGFVPKAIYVCRTNISQEDGTRDNPARPFSERKAPPILIWRYLVETHGIDPAEIAIYCDLKFDKHNRPPETFVHFSGGDEDFAVFSQGAFKHVIFNKSLQEGWDDPACCFAYIDKSMASTIDVEQVVGRALRQPGARHYSDPDLNTAKFYIRIDDSQEFPRILLDVQRRIASELPEVKIDGYSDKGDRERSRLQPCELMTVPQIHINSEEAIHYNVKGKLVGPFADAVTEIHDYTADTINTLGKGELVRAVQQIGHGSKASVETLELLHSNRVLARWVVRRGIQSLYPRVAFSIDWADVKFDARVEITSPAAIALRGIAEKLVDTYLGHSTLAFEELYPYAVGPILVKPSKLLKYPNALHEGYSDLNETLEQPFANAIEATGLKWCRNPSNGGYSIPLLDKGDTANFYPDFLIWKDGVVFAFDPKGEHLINKDAGRKLLDIRDENGKQKVIVRLFTRGKWSDPAIPPSSDLGFTVWSMRAGKPHARHYPSVDKAVEAAVKV